MRPIREAYIDQMQTRMNRGEQDPYVQTMRALPDSICGVQGIIDKIRLYPGKSLGELLVSRARINEYGLSTTEGLRSHSFMLAEKNPRAGRENEPDYVRLSQREEPTLVLVTPEYDGSTLRYSAPGMESFALTLDSLQPRQGTPVTVRIAKDRVRMGVEEEENGPVTAHVRQYLRQCRGDIENIRVLFQHAAHPVEVDERHRAGQEGYAGLTDGSQVSVGSESDRMYLWKQNKKHYGKGVREPLMKEYRPTFEVHGWPTHLNDIFAKALICGSRDRARELLSLHATDLSVRCKVTQVDTANGKFFKDNTPWEAISKDRPRRLAGEVKIPTFAMNAMFAKEAWGATVTAGDVITALREKMVD